MHRFTAAGAGFFIRGGRNILTACTAQENGGHGFVLVGHSSQVTGCRSASSSWHDCVSGEAKPAEAADFFVTNWAHDISGTSNMTVDIPTPHRATDMGVAVKLEINNNTIN